MKVFTVVGFGACALIAVGVMNWGTDFFQGTADTEDIPVYVNNEFVDVGVAVPAQQVEPAEPAWPAPRHEVPEPASPPPPGSDYGH